MASTTISDDNDPDVLNQQDSSEDDSTSKKTDDSDKHVSRIANSVYASRSKKDAERIARLEAQIESLVSATTAAKKPDEEATKESLSLKTLHSKMQESEARRLKAEEKSRNSTISAKFSQSLTSLGVTDPIQQQAIKALLKSRVSVTEDGEDEMVIFKDEDGEEVDFDSGVSGWLKTVGKSFIPSTGNTGSGGKKVVSKTQTQSKKMSDADFARIIMKNLDGLKE